MIVVNIIIVVGFIMLALLSRIHFSKYKAKKETRGVIKCLLLSMGAFVYELFKSNIKNSGIKSALRKVNVVSEGTLEEMSADFYKNCIGIMLGVVFLFNLLSGVVGIKEMLDRHSDENILVREDYAGGEEEYSLSLSYGDAVFQYSISVAPLEYSKEEFYSKTEEIFLWLEEEILGDNSDKNHITYDLTLPLEDPEGVFDISWDSDNPMLIDSNGRIFRENIENECTVCLRAKIEYMDYVDEREFLLTLENIPYEEQLLIDVKDQLENIEEDNRHLKALKLPENIQGVRVSLQEKNENRGITIFLIGLILCFLVMLIKKEQLIESGKKRDNMLKRSYASFINKLSLLMETGMTVKKSIEHITRTNSGSEVLIRELLYSLNQIGTGKDEAMAYEELGKRINIPEYIKVMGQISHNLKRGNSDVLLYLRKEVSNSYQYRKDLAKRLGEEASIKLLFPMIVMLMVVMVIVITPAIYSF